MDYRRAGVDELVLTFAGEHPADQIEYLGEMLARHRG